VGASSSAVRIAIAVLAIAFFAVPVTAGVLGVDAKPFENRRLAHAPKPAQGWGAFQQTTRYLVDHMPLREQAVRANTRIWTDVFDTDPRYGDGRTLAGDEALPFAGTIEDDEGAVLGKNGGFKGKVTAKRGRDGWLFVEPEFGIACDPPIQDEVALARWGRMMAALRKKGYAATMFVVPTKASVYPEYLPEKYPADDCALTAKRRFWQLLERKGRSLGVNELRSELIRLKGRFGDELFELTDSHWTTLGALTLVDAALKEIGNGVRVSPEEIVERGMVSYVGDLSLVSGDAEAKKHMEYGIKRAPEAPRVPGRTVLICDSFAYKWLRLFKPYFEHLDYVTQYDGPSEMTAAIERADTVIVEANEIFYRNNAVGPVGEAVPTTIATDLLDQW
jgi:hypothetical protein